MTKQHDLIRSFIAQNFYVPDVQSLADDTSLLDQGIVDSTGVLEVTAFLEAQFGIKVEDAEIVPENVDTIANIVAFVKRKSSEHATSTASAQNVAQSPA